MNPFLYYFDKWTAWLDFSWLGKKANTDTDADDNNEARFVDPLLRK
jgi:hypothetical protein